MLSTSTTTPAGVCAVRDHHGAPARAAPRGRMRWLWGGRPLHAAPAMILRTAWLLPAARCLMPPATTATAHCPLLV